MLIEFSAGDLFANEHRAEAFAHGCNCADSTGVGTTWRALPATLLITRVF